MEHLASAAHASNFSAATEDFRHTNCFGGSIDIEELLKLFTENGLRINAEHGEAALQACANLEYSKCTQEEFLNVMKEYCSVHKQLGGLAQVAAGAVPVVGAAFGLMLALVKVSNSIKDRAKEAKDKIQAAELRAQYLRGLATADNLSIEATKIAIVMQELISRGLDDFETMNLNASSNATIQLLREDLLPYLKGLNGKDPSNVKIFELRQKRWELKQRLIRQYEIVNVHVNRVEQGLAEMRAGNTMYYIKTNRLIAYARECLLEIHLRAWYAMMGYFDPENTMIEYDDRNVGIGASEKVARIQELFEQYTQARMGMLHHKYESKRDVRGITKHEHTVFLSDHAAESDVMVPRLSIKSLMSRAYVTCQEPEGGGIDHFPDGSCEIWNDTMFSGEDRCSAIGRYVDKAIKRYVSDQLQVDGPVWTSSLGFVDRMRRAVQPAVPQRPLPRTSVTAPSRVPFLQGPVTTSSRIPMVQGGPDETPSRLPAFQGYCETLSDSASNHHHESYS